MILSLRLRLPRLITPPTQRKGESINDVDYELNVEIGGIAGMVIVVEQASS